MEYSNLFVVVMGMGTVFVGLICLVFLVMAASAICRKLKRSDAASAAPAIATPVQSRMDNGKKPELLAAIAAAVAEDMGTDVSAIRIVSIKKV